jgi:hypothetical protein
MSGCGGPEVSVLRKRNVVYDLHRLQPDVLYDEKVTLQTLYYYFIINKIKIIDGLQCNSTRAGRSGDRIRVGAEVFRTRPNRPR